MKKFTFNKQFMVLMFLLLNCFASYAADEELITEQITIKLTEAGTLPKKIVRSKKYLVTNLKIIGEINGTDLRYLREMAGCYVKGENGKLSILDLSEARIVEGGDYYYDDGATHYGTSNDIMGDCAFTYCKSLTSIKLPSSVTKIDGFAFCDCPSLTSVNIPSSVTEIGRYAFASCSSLTSVNIPSKVKEIRDKAFYDCTSLTSINIPSSVTEIGEEAFSGCSSLTSVNIPSSVTEIGESAFEYCKSLTSVNMQSGVTKIRNNAFSSCSSLTSVNIPSSVTEIGMYAFSDCTSLASIKIPSSIKFIKSEAFCCCKSLKSIYVFAEDVPSTSNGAFEGCDSKNCTVYVPKGTCDAYLVSEFGYFENIVEFDATTSIHNTVATPEVKETARYAVNGQRLTAPIKGINLVKYSDGTVKKEFVK
uniref:leucine-rich repeat domain-containing protein n=1 Tax=Alloprevotella sp. TaxID=1872471 RepID=UPI0040251A09